MGGYTQVLNLVTYSNRKHIPIVISHSAFPPVPLYVYARA